MQKKKKSYMIMGSIKVEILDKERFDRLVDERASENLDDVPLWMMEEYIEANFVAQSQILKENLGDEKMFKLNVVLDSSVTDEEGCPTAIQEIEIPEFEPCDIKNSIKPTRFC